LLRRKRPHIGGDMKHQKLRVCRVTHHQGSDNRDVIYPTAFRKKAATDSEELRLTL
jgi:hypothetical protein